MAFQCRKEVAPPPQQHFLETVNLSPAQKSYHVNDTVWIKYMTASKTFFDTISSQRLSTNTIRFGFGASLLPKYGAPQNPADGFCSFILPPNVTPRYITNESGTSTRFILDCDNTSAYHLQVGIILNYPGVYVMNVPDGTQLEACANQANPYPHAWLQFIYDNADCNKDIYLSIPESQRQEFPAGFTAIQIDLKVAYAFTVQ